MIWENLSHAYGAKLIFWGFGMMWKFELFSFQSEFVCCGGWDVWGCSSPNEYTFRLLLTVCVSIHRFKQTITAVWPQSNWNVSRSGCTSLHLLMQKLHKNKPTDCVQSHVDCTSWLARADSSINGGLNTVNALQICV